MESRQGGGEVTADRVPGCCNHERCVMRTISGRYLYSLCDFEGKANKVQCRMYGFCIYEPLNKVYRIASFDTAKSDDSLCRTYILTNDLGDAIWIEHTTQGLKTRSIIIRRCVWHTDSISILGRLIVTNVLPLSKTCTLMLHLTRSYASSQSTLRDKNTTTGRFADLVIAMEFSPLASTKKPYQMTETEARQKRTADRSSARTSRALA